jgi:hypothetical protein
VDESNQASLGHCYKMGYRATHRVTCLKILGWRMRRCVPIPVPAGVKRNGNRVQG